MMKKIIYLVVTAVLLLPLTPLPANAVYNDVTATDSTAQIYISAKSIYLTIDSSIAVQSFTVNANSLSIVMPVNSTIKLTSTDRTNYWLDNASCTAAITCGASSSYATITCSSAQTVVVTFGGANTCTGGDGGAGTSSNLGSTGGGGGGGGGAVTPVTPTVAVVSPTAAHPDASCPTLSALQMIKVTNKPAIYILDSNLKYRYMPDGDVFKSWNADDTYSKYYTTITQACFDSLQQPATAPYHVSYRPGSFIVKYLSGDTLYVVTPGNTLVPVSASVAKALYGSTYKAKTIGLSEWPYYTKSATALTEAKAHSGMLVKSATKTYYVNGTTLQEVTSSGIVANRFKPAFVHNVTDAMIAGLTVGEKIIAEVPALTSRL